MSSEAPAKRSMKLVNVIIVIDEYCVTGTGADAERNAIEATMELIRAGEISPTQFKALEINASPVRPACRDRKPIVSGDVSDEDFEKLKGKTTQEVYDLLTKRG